MTQIEHVYERIDEANAKDPNRDAWQDAEHPRELLYGRRMTGWLDRLYPDASDPLKIAVRAQHIRRWEVPRKDYPEGRAGYHQWRTYLYRYHGERAAEIMQDLGYDAETIERVKFLLAKKKLKTDPETQALEDVACMVFLENYFEKFIEEGGIEDEHMIDIVRKTWAKMSDRAHAAALELELPPNAARIVQAALAG